VNGALGLFVLILDVPRPSNPFFDSHGAATLKSSIDRYKDSVSKSKVG
jgi:hypothetical protein